MAERERLKKRGTKRDTYTFSDSMVLQQALAALRVQFRLNFFAKVADGVSGWKEKKTLKTLTPPVCVYHMRKSHIQLRLPQFYRLRQRKSDSRCDAALP